jgi:nucleotide-binding universal stress UspA family protein
VSIRLPVNASGLAAGGCGTVKADWLHPPASGIVQPGDAMLKPARILCPVDFSEFSEKAYAYAYSLARHYGAKLYVQHVTEPVLTQHRSYITAQVLQEMYLHQAADVSERMDGLMNKYPAGAVQAERVIHPGVAADLILSFAEENAIDLIAMGTHGRRGLDRVTMGSTFERVLRKAPCAVLAVHETVRDFVSPASPDEPVQLRRILWCTDFSENSPRALEFALSLAFEYDAEIALLHVLETAGDAGREQHVLELLEKVVPDEARTWAHAVPQVLTGEPYQKIIEHAERAQSDLIVMGVRGRNIVDLAIFGSTTHRVVQLGPCPVLTVRT